MSVRTPGFLSEPKVEFLTAVLEKLRQGMLEVPRFQRPFVWSDDKQLELLRSVREGLPIGSLMIWQTRAAVAASEQLGERRLPRSTEALHHYLLDGQQRMATLYGALVPPAPEEPEPSLAAYFDLEENDFVLLPTGEEAHTVGEHGDERQRKRYLPLTLVLDSMKLRRWRRDLPEEVADGWIERSDEVATAFKDYKLATITIATDDLDKAIRTFERVNTQGTQMSGVHMVHALSWSDRFDMLDELEGLRKEHLADIGWDEIDDERILDVCRARLGLPLDGSLGDRLARELRARPAALREAVEDIARAARFLSAHCHVLSPRLLPYRQQLLVLAVALRAAPEPEMTATGRLIAWFWVSTLTGWFEGEGVAARNRLRESLEQITDIAEGRRKQPFGQRTERRPLGPTFNIKAGRGRALVLLMSSLRPRLVSGGEVNLGALLDQKRLDVAWMLPRERVGEEHASPGNRFLLPVPAVAELRRVLTDPARPWSQLEATARSHAVTEDARKMLLQGCPQEFVSRRRRELDDQEERMLRSHLDALD
jgi:Protein of unknown function DUF262